MAIGEMHQMDVAIAGNVVQFLRRRRGRNIWRVQHHAGRSGNAKDLHELAAVKTHLDFGFLPYTARGNVFAVTTQMQSTH